MRYKEECKKCQCKYCDTRWEDEDCSGECGSCNGKAIKECGSSCGYRCDLD